MADTQEQTHGTFVVDTDQVLLTAQKLRALNEYGPVAIFTREEGYDAEKGFRPLPVDADQRRIHRLGHDILTVTDEDGVIGVSVNTPTGARDLSLADIETVRVDHPLSSYMPLTGQRMGKLGLIEWVGQQNVARWLPRFYETFHGGHYYDALESSVDPEDPTIGSVTAYDISSPDGIRPWPRETTLEEAKAAERPHTLYLISRLGSIAAEKGVTVITARMGYDDNDRMATVLRPRDKGMAERVVNMLSISDPTDGDAYEIHRERVERLSAEHGAAVPLSLMDVDDAFLYMSHD